MSSHRLPTDSILMLVDGGQYYNNPQLCSENVRAVTRHLRIESSDVYLGTYLGSQNKYVIYVENILQHHVQAVRQALIKQFSAMGSQVVDEAFSGISSFPWDGPLQMVNPELN